MMSVVIMADAGNSIDAQPGKQLPHVFTAVVDNDKREAVSIPYLLFVPQGYRPDGNKKWPLMLFLHGLGECGNGGDELARVKIHGPASLVESRPDFPFVVVSPQCPMPKKGMKDVPTAWKPEQLIKLVDHITTELAIDRTRVYATGLSMGGYGTWRLVAAYPDRFAATVPICGGGEPEGMAKNLRRVPIWAFHGARDTIVPLSRSQEMVDAVRRAGGNVELTVYPEIEHNSWKQTYDNQKVYDWLLSHRGPLRR